MSCSLHTVGTETLLEGLKNAQWTNYLSNKGCAVMTVANVACYYHQITVFPSKIPCATYLLSVILSKVHHRTQKCP